jgi:hypothetical protein
VPVAKDEMLANREADEGFEDQSVLDRTRRFANVQHTVRSNLRQIIHIVMGAQGSGLAAKGL